MIRDTSTHSILRGLSQLHFVEHQRFFGRERHHVRNVQDGIVSQSYVIAHIEIDKSTNGSHRRNRIGIQRERLQDFRQLVGFLIAGGNGKGADPRPG